MTDPKEQQRQQDAPDELELDAEIVRDLEADAETATGVQGGAGKGGPCTVVTGPTMNCP